MGKHKESENHRGHRSHDKDDGELVNGVVLQHNFSPRGGVEGLLLAEGERTFQVNVPPDVGPMLCQWAEAGRRIDVAVVREPETPKHAECRHPVYRLVSRTLPGTPECEESARVEGHVERFNYTRHGEINGVVLDTGDFVHTRPDGFKKLSLVVGQRIVAQGRSRPMPAGRRVIEADVVDGVVLAPRWLHH